jgi:hypothetical protein
MTATSGETGETAWVCRTCGVQHAPSTHPPRACAICEDERQYVLLTGQQWTSLEQMRDEGYRSTFEELEANLVSVQTEPDFAIGQHAIVVRTPAGNVLWDCTTYIDEETVDRVRDLGGVAAIAISHPHFYASCVEWAHAFDAPVYLPALDEAFVMRRDPLIRFFDEDAIEPVAGVTVVRVSGHFRGSAVMLWPDGAGGRGVLLTGDTIALVADPRSVTVMYSYPNRIPLAAQEIRDTAEGVLALEFDRIYDGWRGDVMMSGAKDSVRRSLDRYVRMLEGTWPRG